MQKVKWRLQAIEEIKSKKRTTSFEHTNIEFCVLQIRKILELIALSSLVSDADIYKEQLNNVEKMWNARLILNDIERINPKFFPQPICIDPLNTSIWNKRQEPSLTRDSFVRIYERCGKYLHEDSPFKTEKQIKDTQVLNSSPCMNKLSMSPKQSLEWLKYGYQYQGLASMWNK